MPVPDFQFPAPERLPWRHLPVIVLIHFGLLWVLQWSGKRPLVETERVVRLVQLSAPTVLPPDPAIPWEQLDVRGGPTVASEQIVRSRGQGNVEDVASALAPLALAEVVAVPREVPDAVEPPLPSPIDTVVPLVGTNRRLGVAFGDGRFWIEPRLTVRERIEVAMTVAELDSLYKERILAAIDALPPDSFAMEDGPDSWSATILGEEFGIDRQFITIAGFKIPTALMALLPISLPEGDIFAARDARQNERNRREIIENAQRQADLQDIRRYIREMRERKDAERELRRALEASKDTVVATRDTIIPR